MKQQYLQVGKITKTHGIMGQVRVEPWADSPEFLLQFKQLYVGDTCWPIQVVGAKVNGSMVIMQFYGITDVNGALAMRGQVLSFDRTDVELPPGSFFLADLIGLEARDAATGEVLGSIDDILTLPAHNVYVVRGGQREIMVPAVTAFLAETNLEDGFVRINMIEGL